MFFLAGCCAPAGPLVKVPPPPNVVTARAEKTLTWYTPLRRETAQKLATVFRNTVGIEVQIVRGSDLELASRFLQAVREERVEVDVLQLTDPGLIVGLKLGGLLRKAEVPNRLRLPHWMRGSAGFWAAPYVVTVVLGYRADRVKPADRPRSWRDLADARFRKLLVLPDPAEGGPGFYWAAAMARLHGWDFLEALGRNAAAVVPYREAAERMVRSSEAVSGGLSGEDVWRGGEKGGSVVLRIPSEGIPAIPAAVALPRGAAHPQAAMLFLNFLLSAEAQRLLAEDGFYPALPGSAPPPGRIALDKLRLLQVSWERTAKEGDKLRQRLRRSLGGGNLVSDSALDSSMRRTSLRLEEGPPTVRPAGLSGRFHPCGWFGLQDGSPS